MMDEGRNLISKEVCIILINYYNNNNTIECIHSISESQIGELPFIVIVDNSAVDSNLEKEISFYPFFKYILSDHNLGFARGNNLGIKWARENIDFKYLLILNNDTIVGKDTLQKLINVSLQNHEVSVFTPCIITEESTPRIWYAGGKINYLKMSPDIYLIGKPYKDIVLKNGYTEFASGCCIFIVNNKNDILFEEIFDPYFFMYDEDVDLSFRLKKKNKKIYFICDAIIRHKCQGSQKRKNIMKINQLSPYDPNLIFYLNHTIRNRYYIINKHFSGLKKTSLNFTLTIYWFLKCLQYLFYLNYNAFICVLKCLFSLNKNTSVRLK